jgi:hypothetical protein
MIKISKDLKADQDQAVMTITRAAHPYDLGEETSKLEELIYQETEKLIRAAKHEQKMFDVHLIRTSGWYWTERLVRKIILWV